MISIKGVTRKYKNGKIEVEVLKGVDLDIKKGEFVAIMGKSGAGKSTLMYQMSLLDIPSSGSINVDNSNTLLLDEKERTDFRLRELGYVFQDYALVPELTAEENIAIPLIMQGVSESEARSMAHDSLVRVDMKGKNNNRTNQLSGGEQQRVSIARAIVQKPKILFADEPTANLDSASSDVVIDIFRDLHQKGQTIVMVTHELEYTKYCDRIVFMEDGKITDYDYKIKKHL